MRAKFARNFLCMFYIVCALFLLQLARSIYKTSNLDATEERQFEKLPPARKRLFSRSQFVFVIIVHDRIEYLKQLIESLRNVAGIEQTTVIFSHDYRSQEIDYVVRKETMYGFGKIEQIFNPYRMQLFPDQFPGESKNDCPRDISPIQAKQINCTNWLWPDKHGHYREANFVQVKYHYWWMFSFMRNNWHKYIKPGGRLILLEEDFFVAPDALRILEKMLTHGEDFCSECDLLVLGQDTFLNSQATIKSDFSKLEADSWDSKEYFRGVAFSKKNLDQWLACSEQFCTFDDYNPDWSLMHVNVKCFAQPWKMLKPAFPRVLHTGRCGMHRKTQAHHCHDGAQEFSALFRLHRKLLFPKTLQMTSQEWTFQKPASPEGFGGWGDKRDHELCKKIPNNV